MAKAPLFSHLSECHHDGVSHQEWGLSGRLLGKKSKRFISLGVTVDKFQSLTFELKIPFPVPVS